MTDSEIIRALHCCISLNTYGGECDEGCPYVDCKSVDGCFVEMFKDILSLINIQKVRIESLQDLNKQLEIDNFNANTNLSALTNQIYEIRKMEAEVKFFKKKIKAEAIKEFAERLKENLETNSGVYYMNGFYDGFSIRQSIAAKVIDNLVKEMVGDSDG